MPLLYRLTNILKRMTFYGFMLGSASGLLVALTILLLPNIENPNFLGIPFTPLTAILGGAGFGMLFGTVAGFTSGFGMALFTLLLFREVHDEQGFRIFMGSTTFMLTLATLVGRGLWTFGEYAVDPFVWQVTMAMTLVIAIYASQRTATKYLLDIQTEKTKR